MKSKTKERLDEYVRQFNEVYPVGSNVSIRVDTGEIVNTKVQSPATVLGGHSAVGWFEGMGGCYSLDRVRGCD